MKLSLAKFLNQRISPASLVAFRVFFGLVMMLSMIRFLAKGWVESLYIKPSYFFTYYGFSWVKPLPEPWIYLPFLLLVIFALCIALGLFYRVSTILFFILFTYIELLDQSNYLNHYYFINILAGLLIFLPLHKNFSFDVLRKPKLHCQSLPRWCLSTVRLQVGIVYFFAGVAKLNSDWLWKAQPLKFWLAANPDFFLLGSWMKEPALAYIMSWLGAFFDLSIPFLLLYRPTRKIAYLGIILFHLMTWKLFNIGMFPWVMMGAALIFFPPQWPLSLLQLFKLKRREKKLKVLEATPQPLSFQKKLAFSLLGLHFCIQIVLPLRHWMYPGNVLWTEEGFRYAWKVMLMEKSGSVTYEIIDPKTEKKWILNPANLLKPHQYKQMSTQPDMILAFAHKLAKDFANQGYPHVEVKAQAFASLNGRLPQRLINSQTDLAKMQDSLWPKAWIVSLASHK